MCIKCVCMWLNCVCVCVGLKFGYVFGQRMCESSVCVGQAIIGNCESGGFVNSIENSFCRIK